MNKLIKKIKNHFKYNYCYNEKEKQGKAVFLHCCECDDNECPFFINLEEFEDE